MNRRQGRRSIAEGGVDERVSQGGVGQRGVSRLPVEGDVQYEYGRLNEKIEESGTCVCDGRMGNSVEMKKDDEESVCFN